MNLAIINGFRQLPQATGLNYSIVNDDGPRPKALGWEIFENNAMDSTLTGAAADYLSCLRGHPAVRHTLGTRIGAPPSR